MKKTMHISIKKPQTAAPVTVSINVPLSVLRTKENTDANVTVTDITVPKAK